MFILKANIQDQDLMRHIHANYVSLSTNHIPKKVIDWSLKSYLANMKTPKRSSQVI